MSFIGKLLYALPLSMFGFFHFMNASAMAGIVPSFLPFAQFWVYLTGTALILAAVAIIIDKKAKLATTLLGIMLAIFAVFVHLPGFLDMAQPASSMFLKDTALSGAAFFFSAHLKN
ncbi:DoxX family protein [Marinoscillum sp. MHG1-6]|uniref:DoxX family protein n=1 Tax=Marinoscillum sp. MHG1-6 TaxID=2959627 RepID=UPI002157181D|nr:DoxX family protein [Marinoscillum sp. MHG1-6]